MNIQNPALQNFKISPYYETLISNVAGKIKNVLICSGNHIYETPVWVIASTIIGIALLIFHPPLATPFLGLAMATELTRLAGKIIEAYNLQQFKVLRENMFEYQQKYPYIQYLVFATSLVASAFFPIAGAVLSSLLGIYKGMIAEIDIFKYKQDIIREKLKHPASNLDERIINY